MSGLNYGRPGGGAFSNPVSSQAGAANNRAILDAQREIIAAETANRIAAGTSRGARGGYLPGYGGGSRGGGNASISQIIQNLINSQNEQLAAANAANERRFDQGLRLLDEMQANTQGQFQATLSQGIRDIEQGFNTRSAEILQDQFSRGLGNASSVGALQLQNQALQTDAENRLRNDVTLAQLGAETDISMRRLGFIEDREDVATTDFLPLISDLVYNLAAGG